MASGLKGYQTWQATEELYFWQIEAKLLAFSGTKAIHKRKQIEASKGLTKFSFFFCNKNLLSFLNLLTPWKLFRLGLKEEAIITK